MSTNLEIARAEILHRLTQRDSMITLFGTAFTALLGYAIERSNYELLLSVPGLALTLVLFSIYYDSNIEFLHRYAKRIGGSECWDGSPERIAYSKSKLRWLFVVAQTLVFGGSCIAALALNARVWSTNDSTLLLIWVIDLLLTVFTIALLLYMRVWRHKNSSHAVAQDAA